MVANWFSVTACLYEKKLSNFKYFVQYKLTASYLRLQRDQSEIIL